MSQGFYVPVDHVFFVKRKIISIKKVPVRREQNYFNGL